MRKIFFAMLVATAMSGSAIAACDGGTEIGEFCISNAELNWWSAANWCQSNGMHLPTIYEVCPGWGGYDEDGIEGTFEDCTRELSLAKNCWTATSFNSQSAFILRMGANYTSVSASSKNNSHRALCVY